MRIPVWAALNLAAIAAASPSVRVSLRSSWPAPPFLTEVLETVALENPDAFFPLVDAITDPDAVPSVHKMTPEAIRQFVLATARKAGHLLVPGSEAMVDMQLGLHAATPKIQAFYHHFSEIDDSRKPKCGSWVDWYGQAICDVETLVQLTNIDTIDSEAGLNPSFPRPTVFSFDHIYPSPASVKARPPRTAILYASFASDNFRELHSHLLSVAGRQRHHIEYILRYVPQEKDDQNDKSYLSGYGVALDLKKMEYSAVDDRVKYTESEKGTALEEENSSDFLLDQIQDAVVGPASKLLETDIYELGVQSTQFIANSTYPLETLALLSQDFPKYAYTISRGVNTNAEVEEEIMMNTMKAPSGASQMWLNGVILQDQDISAFGLLRLLKKERSIIAAFSELGLSSSDAIELITHPAVSASQVDSGAADGLFDASDRLEGGGLTVWWNDIEKDKRYQVWPSTIQTILRPHIGALPNVRLNLFNVILAIDLSHTDNIHFLASVVNQFVSRGFPLRFGIIPVGTSEDAIKMARILYYLNEHRGVDAISGLFQHVAMHRLGLPKDKQVARVDWKPVREFFEDPSQEGISDYDSVRDSAEYDPVIEKTRAYTPRLNIDLVSSPRGHAFLNGKAIELDDNFLRVIQSDVSMQLNYLQEQVYTGQVGPNEDFGNFFYNLPTTLQRRNKYIFPSASAGLSLRVLGLYDLLNGAGFPTTSGVYMYSPHPEEVFSTFHIVADLDSEAGLQFVKEALEFLPNSKSRITFVHNPAKAGDLPAPEQAPASWLFSHLVSKDLLSKQSITTLLNALGLSPAGDDDSQKPLSSSEYFSVATGGLSARDLDPEKYADYVEASGRLSRDISLGPGSNGLIVNGRIIGPIDDGQFLSFDFASLENFEYTKRIEPVVTALRELRPELVKADKGTAAHSIAVLSSLTAAVQLPASSEGGMYEPPKRPRTRSYEKLDGNHTSFSIGDKSTALYQIGVLLDPLSEAAQKWSGLLQWVLAVPDVYIHVYLNPQRTKELPLKRFYRNNLMPVLQFGDDGVPRTFTSEFHKLPMEPIYTLAMDVPPAWLVRPRQAAYDLDNIQLRTLSPRDQISGLTAAFELDYLVIDGHARDKRTQAPPRGLQLQLTQADSKIIDDTQVVANLGYFQFKAKPGIFKLEIRPGRGRKIYDIESVGNEGWDSPTVDQAGNTVTLTSFEGLILYPRFQRHAGMETADVLAEEEVTENEGVFSNIVSGFTSLFGSKKAEPVTTAVAERHADINIFTVASGLLYERFASIMILSVLRNTNSTVKFWFIENFLSPSFLEFIPHFAKEYNFQYELVTYKWPSWLRAQTEKQRIIWAYKILFLDVLFPMDLKKVIFVDADQIVRADLQELVDLDLQGAPYGYTPMGDDNTDMEGFRFWKTGYWKDFLRGRPYHISALYVVDLARFRQMAAGDILRAQYQALSADPGSLANLDQDLPNNLQREVPIFSLDEDWLWCETWCSTDRLHRAKTIDLCQNPLTKEPKLARARKIPEWEEYDAEIARLAQSLEKRGLLQTGITGEGVDMLAGTSAPSTQEAQEAQKDEPAAHDEL